METQVVKRGDKWIVQVREISIEWLDESGHDTEEAARSHEASIEGQDYMTVLERIT